MKKIKYTYYKDGDFWVGWLETYPDYRTQGATMEELEENLRDILNDIEADLIPFVRRTGELAIK
jgi:predicted RNase H-like HicB family nuclease